MHNIIILGPQGSGKGTQSRMLAEKFNLEQIEPGKRLRQLSEQRSALGKKINYYMNQKGCLVPTYVLINEVLKEWINSLSKTKGVVCDGTPRRLREAIMLEKMLKKTGRVIDYIFFIKISEKETFKRLSIRLTCKKCNKQFIEGKDTSVGEKKCLLCKGKLYKRKDDNEQGVRNRLAIYYKETMLVVNYYKEQGRLIEINGEQTIQAVQRDILQYIK